MSIIKKNDYILYAKLLCFQIVAYMPLPLFQKINSPIFVIGIIYIAQMILFLCIIPFSYYLLYKKDKKNATIVYVKPINHYNIFLRRTLCLYVLNVLCIFITSIAILFLYKVNLDPHDILKLIKVLLMLLFIGSPHFLTLFFVVMYVITCLLFKDKRVIMFIVCYVSHFFIPLVFEIFAMDQSFLIIKYFILNIIFLCIGCSIMKYLFKNGFEL